MPSNGPAPKGPKPGASPAAPPPGWFSYGTTIHGPPGKTLAELEKLDRERTLDACRLDWLERHEAQLSRTIADDNDVRGYSVHFVDPSENEWRYGEGDTLRDAIDDAMRMTGDLS